MFAAAFYKSTKPGIPGLYNRVVRLFEGGPYSHCELIFSDGQSASASYMDGGVRFMDGIDFANGKWDVVPLNPDLEQEARAWFLVHVGQSYDLRGNLRFVLPWGNRDSKNKQFCSESLLSALGVNNAWRFGVNAAADVCERLCRQ